MDHQLLAQCLKEPRAHRNGKRCVNLHFLRAQWCLNGDKWDINEAVVLGHVVHVWCAPLGPHGGLDLLCQVLLGIADHLEPTRLLVEAQRLWETLK